MFLLSQVVSYSISTSNHNFMVKTLSMSPLYLIPFLHQTTTLRCFVRHSVGCILFHFYIKPQRHSVCGNTLVSCILFHFYIKPQRWIMRLAGRKGCILFHFYIKPQLQNAQKPTGQVVSYSISTSNHNCRRRQIAIGGVVSYSISTSNHNSWYSYCLRIMLYLIPFLHQTTTKNSFTAKAGELYLIPFLHQTTTN